jgi:HAD superfamily hydrolase (TIGR01509 family)
MTGNGRGAADGSPLDLAIFDCDGVLVDSEPLAMRVLLETIAEAGLVLEPAHGYERFLGRSLAHTCAVLSAEFGIDLTHEALDRMRLRLYEVFRRELRPIAGIHATLDALPVPYCVASSSQPERIRLALEVTGLLGRFEGHLFSASMVSRGKPAPDLFLHAAAEMAVAPARCLVVEDSLAGIEAAKLAGMRVCGFTGGSHARTEPHRKALAAVEPDHLIDDIRVLPELFGRHKAG